MEDAILECGGADLRVVSRQQAGELAQGTVDETPCPAGKSSLGPQTSLETSPAPRSETLQGRTACWTNPLVLATLERMQPRNQQTLFWHPGVVISNTLTHSLDSLPRFRGQVCKIPGATV